MRCANTDTGKRGRIRAPTHQALVRAIRLRDDGCVTEADREEKRAFALVRADRARTTIALEDVVRAIRLAWDRVHGPAAPLAGRTIAYYRLIARCLRTCVRLDPEEVLGGRVGTTDPPRQHRR